MRQPLGAEAKAIVKSTAPALQQHGLAITQRMYERLFVDPEVKAMFDQAAQESGEQPRRLAGAILAYAQNIDKLEALTGPVMRMAARHVETGVKVEHYPLVANALLPAIRDILGEAYWALAEILIGNEQTLYAEVESTGSDGAAQAA